MKRAKCFSTASQACKGEPLDYAHILIRCYLKRMEYAMADQLPLVRQWVLLRTLMLPPLRRDHQGHDA